MESQGPGVGVRRQSDPRLHKIVELRAQGGSGDGHPPVHTGHRQHAQAWQVFLGTPMWGLLSPGACVMVCREGSGQKDPPASCVLSAIPVLCQLALASMWLLGSDGLQSRLHVRSYRICN